MISSFTSPRPPPQDAVQLTKVVLWLCGIERQQVPSTSVVNIDNNVNKESELRI
jgi:hypothetical protein